jgi:hypothetical protein
MQCARRRIEARCTSRRKDEPMAMHNQNGRNVSIPDEHRASTWRSHEQMYRDRDDRDEERGGYGGGRYGEERGGMQRGQGYWAERSDRSYARGLDDRMRLRERMYEGPEGEYMGAGEMERSGYGFQPSHGRRGGAGWGYGPGYEQRHGGPSWGYGPGYEQRYGGPSWGHGPSYERRYGGPSWGYGPSYERRYGGPSWGWGPQGYGEQGYGQREPGYGRGMERGGYRGKGPVGYTRSDERIREGVCEALSDDDSLDASHIEVTVRNGEVILAGTVEDRHSKRMAEDLVERIPGVKDVQNQIKVQERRERGGERGNQSASQQVGKQEVEAPTDKRHRA